MPEKKYKKLQVWKLPKRKRDYESYKIIISCNIDQIGENKVN